MTTESTLTIEMEDIIDGYVTALLWANAWQDSESEGEPELAEGAHHEYDLSSFSESDQASIREDVEAFVVSNAEDIAEWVRRKCDGYTYSDTSELRDIARGVGHDFLLTRSGHGAGFWDRGMGELGDWLSAAARPFGDTNVLITADGPVLES
jgi:hypothetical protein